MRYYTGNIKYKKANYSYGYNITIPTYGSAVNLEFFVAKAEIKHIKFLVLFHIIIDIIHHSDMEEYLVANVIEYPLHVIITEYIDGTGEVLRYLKNPKLFLRDYGEIDV